MAPLPFSAQDPDLAGGGRGGRAGHSLAQLEVELWQALDQVRQDGVQPLELARARNWCGPKW